MPAPDSAFLSASTKTTLPWLKVDFHLHAAEDPKDELEYSANDLLLRAHQLGFGALAITLHGQVLARPEISERARQLGILLIPAAEVRLEGADVVVLNVTEEEVDGLNRFDDLAALRAQRGRSLFTFAPHPFYRLGGSMGSERLLEHLDLFDAIEISHFHTALLNPNRAAERVARTHGKPLLATSDAHRLDFFGAHYTRVAALPEPEAIFEAIRAGAIEPVSPPYSLPRFARYLWWIFAEHRMRLFQAKVAGHC